jgi:ferric enterobactin receptor
VIQPRLNLEFAPFPALRIRAGAGRLAKVPSLASLYPGHQYYDLVNVNYYANNPAERLAVVTTRIVDKTNHDLGYSVADRLEAGLELNLPNGVQASVVGYHDRIRGAIGFRPEVTYFLRERFRIVDSTIGTGRPPLFEEPAFATDTVPVLIDRPANNQDLTTSGIELVATLPEFARTRLAFLGSWARSRLRNRDIEFSGGFSDFQLNQNDPRTPYWDGGIRTGEVALLTTRIIHHQPKAGLVITGTIQFNLRERRQTVAGVDTLAFAGYLTRDGTLVQVPRERRTDPEFHDLRVPRSGSTIPQQGPTDWLFSLQVSKSLPLEGRLSFYAFNAFDRVGNYGDAFTTARFFAPVRFGLEVQMPVGLWQ